MMMNLRCRRLHHLEHGSRSHHVCNRDDMTTTAEELLERARLRQQLPPPSERRAIRIRSGIAQREMAEALSVSRQTLDHWERGRRRPRGSSVVRYARLLAELGSFTPEATLT